MKDVLIGSYGYVRVASVVPRVNVADVEGNVKSLVESVDAALAAGARVVVTPELSLTGYTCGDLFLNETLRSNAAAGLMHLRDRYVGRDALVVVGVPLAYDGALFNCAAVIGGGGMWVIPKTYIPNYKEFYEKRWFASASILPAGEKQICVCGERFPFGTDMIFTVGRAKVAVEICEDLWVPIPPSSAAALAGANVLVNLSASNELIGKHAYLTDLIRHQSKHCVAAYIYSSCGYGESTTDLVFAGNAIIAENGKLLREGARFRLTPQMAVADIDIEALENDRIATNSFADGKRAYAAGFKEVTLQVGEAGATTPLLRNVHPRPFVPDDNAERDARCEEILNIQTEGLMRRLDATGIKKAVIGISGGVDSTLALLVAVRAFDRLDIDRKNLVGITMPGFGTTARTRGDAHELMDGLGITSMEISINDAVTQHFKDIGQDPNTHDVTYENCQARERTQVLMDYANKIGGLVLGTGDLSELALGWATYNGDHMSMYNVNCSIPKTLAQHLIRRVAENEKAAGNENIHKTLTNILATPISPELTPADEHGNIKQRTEDIIGPYELHDFFLYQMVRKGFEPRKIFFLATIAFADKYDEATIAKWLTNFCKRFFAQQFKRSCLPDGPKVGSVSLSPRGDWRMPSDASARLWMAQCKELGVRS